MMGGAMLSTFKASHLPLVAAAFNGFLALQLLILLPPRALVRKVAAMLLHVVPNSHGLRRLEESGGALRWHEKAD